MHDPEHAGHNPSQEPEILPARPDFLRAYEDIVEEIARPPHEQERDRVGYWRRATENSVRGYSISGQGYSDLGERVSCTIERRDEGLNITVRLPDIFDNRCQLLFVRYSDKENTQSFVMRTPVLPSHPTDGSDIPALETLDERQVQALYLAIVAPSVER